MNERIFELAEQALEETHRVMGDSCLPEARDDFYTEKFAELIVRECSDLFEVEWGTQSLDGHHAGHVLKKHFGVEE